MNLPQLPADLAIQGVLRKSYLMFRDHFRMYLAFGLACAISGSLAERFLDPAQEHLSSFLFFVYVFITSWLTVMLMYATSRILVGQVQSVDQIMQGTRMVYMNYLAVAICAMFVMVIGFIFLIIPGIYLAVIFAFADVLVVAEGKKFMEAFSCSYDLVRGQFWKLLGCLTVILLIAIAPAVLIKMIFVQDPKLVQLLSNVVAVFTAPFYVINKVVLFQEIKNRLK